MADITMCRDTDCPLRERCYRATAPVNEHWQAYFWESPREGLECGMFWERDDGGR